MKINFQINKNFRIVLKNIVVDSAGGLEAATATLVSSMMLNPLEMLKTIKGFVKNCY